ncbi:hypothetical protein Taro_010266, partial [Colocasia esculenta]|nr:hypothetical protein [Colocasia esculenta]
PEIPGASKPSQWGDVPNGYQAIPSPLWGSPNPSPINQTPFYTKRVLFGSLQGEERNPSFCEKNQTLHALIRQLRASSGDPLQLEARVDQGEGFPDPSLLWRSIKNPEEWCFGDFLGLPKESLNDTFDPFGGLIGDTPLEETMESDSELGEYLGGVVVRGGASAREDEPRREKRAEQQAPTPQGPVLPPPPPVDYGVLMQGLVQAMQTQAHTQAALQAQLEAQAL